MEQGAFDITPTALTVGRSFAQRDVNMEMRGGGGDVPGLLVLTTFSSQ